jgi:hypothetical protein
MKEFILDFIGGAILLSLIAILWVLLPIAFG